MDGRDEVVEILGYYIGAIQRDINALNSFEKNEYEEEDLSNYIRTLKDDLYTMIGNLEDINFEDREED